ncbi:hypothetical protein C2S52_018770 [Perilla frutescens var. hirtella]|nr:hypothetical protein C2S52_018770 [Perilla frutescens var. hirtella]
MAYASVKSLGHTIRGLLSSSRISASSDLETLQSALDHATSLELALEWSSGFVSEMDERIIIEESRKLEDAIEFPISTHFLELKREVELFAKTAKKMEANIEELWEQKVAKMIEESIMKLCLPKTEKKSSPQEEEEEDGSSMIGLSDQFLEIRDQLTATERLRDPASIYNEITIWISGMAGIGKTTLAKKLFHDPSVKVSFECRAFVRMGRDYVVFDSEKRIMEGNEDLDEGFWRLFTDRKFLIVFDDVRDDHLSLHQIDGIREGNKLSWILVTSRMDPSHPRLQFSCLKMRFLNEEESWELLRREVFGEDEEDCPSLLVKPGKKIAEKCEGLPLLINAVAPILVSKAQKNVEVWKRVAKKPNSVLEEASHQISEVLLSNYHHLMEDEKLCFLYIVAFPQNYVVLNNRIGCLWYVEGFIANWGYSTIYKFNLLYQNNLVIDAQNGFHKACTLHSAYWHVSRRVAENNKFLYTINTPDDGLDERVKNHRRLAIYSNVLLAYKEVYNYVASVSTVRSLLCTGPYHQYQVPICWEWKLLRVLSALTIRFYEFPVEVVKLTCLKYLALTCNANLPPSISELWNLQFLIVHQHSSIKRVGVVSYLPVEIWDLQELELLNIMGRNLPDPHPGVVLPKLTKLLGVGVESCTKEVLESLPMLKKLRIQIELAPHAGETMSFFDHLSCLDGLSSFRSVVMNPALLLHPSPPPPPPLSINNITSLQSLSLSGFGYPWKDMREIARLPRLTVLKLQCCAFGGEKWEVQETWRLWSLSIQDTDLVQWTARDGAFPWLERLTMKNCHKLQEIPLFPSRNDVKIELVDCNPSAETYTKQRYNTRKNVTVTASYSWNEEKIKSR